MTTVTTEQIQKNFASVKDLMSQGETVLIEEDGIAIGTVHPLRSGPSQQKGKTGLLGALEGQGTIPDDIKGPYEDEINRMFYGE